MKNDFNPHMWIPNNGPEPYDEVCHLCGTFSGGHAKRPDPPEASIPCPEPWPEWPDLTDEEMDALDRASKEDVCPAAPKTLKR